MPEIPNHRLSPEELEKLKRESALERALFALDEAHTKRSEEPSKWFGRLLAVLLTAIFLDTTGWIAAFISGRFYAIFAIVLQTVETLCIAGLAGLAIWGSIEAYKLAKAKAGVRLDFERPPQE